jgi:SAM-dependent methyltransferase
MNSEHDRIVGKVRDFFTSTVNAHGATHLGVDWNSIESQRLRFRELMRLCPGAHFSLIDYGCGYGALAQYLREQGIDYRYQGFDVSEAMIAHAHDIFGPDNEVRSFTSDVGALVQADYTVASGVFNKKLDTPQEEWESYVEASLESMASLSRRGFSFNMLTAYSDEDKKRPDLYYASPAGFFEYCRRYSKRVALLHDYPLYEFTIIVRFE